MAITLRKCRFLPAAAGDVDFVVTSSVAGFVLPVTAGAEDLPYNYMAFFGEEWESGDGLYSIATHTLSRDVILASSNNDILVDFSDIPTVIMLNATEVPPTPGRLIKSTLFTSSTTWTKDSKTKSILAFVTGGGGGSGATNGAQSVSGGAGAGGTGISFLDVTAVTSWAVTVGAGGTAHNGGGQSSLNSTTVVGNGGGGSADTSLDSPSGPGGGGGAVGQIPIVGGQGMGGQGLGGGSGPLGGSSFWGGPGSFGSGAMGQSGGGAGATGKAGAVWILEFS